MDGRDDFEVDPAIAAAMGFAGFGTQPNKKRKFDKDDGFVDLEGKTASTPQGTSANRLPLGEPKAMRTKPQDEVAPTRASNNGGESNVAKSSISSDPPSLEALRQGVKNEHGDMAYFLPSFIEDPWAGLKAQFATAKTDLEIILGYTFQDDDILREALWAAGPGLTRKRDFPEGNKRLALVGDTVLKTVLVHHFYTKGRSRGETDRAAQSALCNANLSSVGRAKAVGQYIVLANINSTVTKNVMATTIEALFGAVFEDSGMDLEAIRRGMMGFGILE